MKTLLANHERVWFYLKDQTTKERFVKDALDLGCRFLNGDPLTVEDCSYIMSVHSDNKIAHVAIFIWNASFQCSQFAVEPLKVDYAKYVCGDVPWICKGSDFIRIG